MEDGHKGLLLHATIIFFFNNFVLLQVIEDGRSRLLLPATNLNPTKLNPN